eukprot:5492973-Prorocentrum_lima.AAC.1
MTSSLVGSEMCIRDRDKDMTNSRVSASENRGRRKTFARDGWISAGNSGCLLYTSDAADDM